MNLKLLISNFKFTIIFFLFLIPQPVFAQVSTSVDVKSNTGNNTICVNGKCTTTTGGASKSKVCVNGKCYEAEGDLEVISDDGKTRVNIKNNNDFSGVSVPQQFDSKLDVDKEVQGTSIEAKNKAEKELKKAEESVSRAQEKAEEKKFDIIKFIEERLALLRWIVTFQFIFGSK
jgi:hypothetical protein